MRPCFHRFHRTRMAQAIRRSAAVTGAVCFLALSGQCNADGGPITAVQTALIREQFLSGEPTGVFDPATRGALRRFQLRQSLPPTGEIDTATILALQNPNHRSATATTPGPLMTPPPTTGESDREFLRRLELGRPEAPLPAEAVPVAVVAPLSQKAAPPKKTPNSASDRVVSPPGEERAKSKPRFATNRENPAAIKPDAAGRRTVEAAAPGSATSPLRSRAASSVAVDTEDDPDILAPRGARIVRSSTTTTGADGRTYVYEKKTTTFAGTPPPALRRTAVESRPRDNGFLHRLFRED